jgi:acyl carrier protein
VGDESLPFPAFRDHLAEQLDVDLSGAGPDSRLADDLELDSIQRLEALVAVEELGVYLADDSVGPEQTLGGLHALYLRARTAGSQAPDPSGEPPYGDQAAGMPGRPERPLPQITFPETPLPETAQQREGMEPA